MRSTAETTAPVPATGRHLTTIALASVAAAVATLALKFGAYGLTGSAGLLSDAVESTANLVAALTAVGALWYASRPVDREHTYGHEKIEFFAGGIEGVLILVAAGGIVWVSVQRLLDPRPLDSLGLGTALAVVASVINLGVGLMLLREARAHRSLVLEADGRHLITDVWTSAGVVVGILAVRWTGIEWLDPLIALAVAVNIVRTGLDLVRTAFAGLMDRALPATEQAAIRRAIEGELTPGMTYHAVRTRHAGSRHLVDFHLLVPGALSVADGHRQVERIERAISDALPDTESTVHVEPIEAGEAWADSPLLPFEEEGGRMKEEG